MVLFVIRFARPRCRETVDDDQQSNKYVRRRAYDAHRCPKYGGTCVAFVAIDFRRFSIFRT